MNSKILDDQVYEWVHFFKGQVYERVCFEIMARQARTSLLQLPLLHPHPTTDPFSIKMTLH